MVDKPEAVGFNQFFRRFPDEAAARKDFEGKRWGGEVDCPHCGSLSIVEVKNHKPMPYRCRECRQHFSVRTGTVLAGSRLPLHKWLMAVFMMTTTRKGIPSTQMACELGISQKSAWFLAHRIRETWLTSKTEDISDRVQVDESYVGTREKNNHSTNKLRAGRRVVGKTAAIGLRGDNGAVTAVPIAEIKADTLKAIVSDLAYPGATVFNEQHAAHVGPDSKAYQHCRVNHPVGEYVRKVGHTKGIESFWTLFKRDQYGNVPLHEREAAKS